MQITFKATTAAIGVENEAITTGKVHLLPRWAPPIEFIDDCTTGPYLAILIRQTSGTSTVNMRTCHVYAYGRRPTLHGGRECVTLSVPNTTSTAAMPKFIVLTYRAVGEVVRP